VDHAANRLRIATKIHFAMRRYLGEGLDVGAMLKDAAYATEVLHVCRASRDPELCALADQFQAASAGNERTQGRSASTGRGAPQDAEWGQNTSGFGITRAMQQLDLAPARKPGASVARWYEARRWFS
jgi:hypothetical protein